MGVLRGFDRDWAVVIRERPAPMLSFRRRLAGAEEFRFVGGIAVHFKSVQTAIWNVGVADESFARIVRVTAPNGGVMTGPGTNTYLVGDPSDRAGVEFRDRLLNGRPASPLRAVLHDASMRAGRGHEQFALVPIVRARLFAIHVFARLQRRENDFLVLMRWRGDDDDE